MGQDGIRSRSSSTTQAPSTYVPEVCRLWVDGWRASAREQGGTSVPRRGYELCTNACSGHSVRVCVCARARARAYGCVGVFVRACMAPHVHALGGAMEEMGAGKREKRGTDRRTRGRRPGRHRNNYLPSQHHQWSSVCVHHNVRPVLSVLRHGQVIVEVLHVLGSSQKCTWPAVTAVQPSPTQSPHLSIQIHTSLAGTSVHARVLSCAAARC